MKKIIALLLALVVLLPLTACSNNKTDYVPDPEGMTYVPVTTKPKEPIGGTRKTYDDELLDRDGNLILTPSEYRIVDTVENGYVIILFSGTAVKAIYSAVEYPSQEEAAAVLVQMMSNGGSETHGSLRVYQNFLVDTIPLDDETYGKFYTMTRKDVLAAFGRDVETDVETITE